MLSHRRSPPGALHRLVASHRQTTIDVPPSEPLHPPCRSTTQAAAEQLLATTLRLLLVAPRGPRGDAGRSALARGAGEHRAQAAPSAPVDAAAPHGAILPLIDWRSRITIEPGKRGGRPCIRGLRITVYDILEYLAGGMSEDEILHDFPDLERDDIRAALAFAAEREKKIHRSSAA